MKCPTPSGYPMCVTCKAAGLSVCAFDKPVLPLVEAEKPKVIYCGRVWAKPSGHIVFEREQNPDSWDVS